MGRRRSPELRDVIFRMVSQKGMTSGVIRPAIRTHNQ